MTTTTPAPWIKLWTLDEYHRLIDTGLLAETRVQLIEGQLIDMPPMNTPHIGAMTYLYRALVRSEVGDRVFSQTPITISRLGEPDWEPEPDVYVARPGASLKPPIEQVDLIAEIADSTYRDDKARKMLRYADVRNGPELWLVSLERQRVEVWLPGTREWRFHDRQDGGNLWLRAGGEASVRIESIFAAAEQP